MLLGELVDPSHLGIKSRDVMVETMRIAFDSVALGLQGERQTPPNALVEMVIEWVVESVLRMIDLKDVFYYALRAWDAYF